MYSPTIVSVRYRHHILHEATLYAEVDILSVFRSYQVSSINVNFYIINSRSLINWEDF